MVIIKTTLGDIKLELDEEKAPETVANFMTYVKEGFYSGTIFHRVIKDFMIQGGGLTSGLVDKENHHSPIKNEADNGLSNLKYTIAMARRTQAPHSATSQFFINTKDNLFLNHTSKDMYGWGYCVFGKVVDGFDVVDKIEAVKTTKKRPYADVPVEEVVITEVVVE